MKVQEIQNEIQKTLAEIETISKQARFESGIDYDRVGRDLRSRAEVLIDLVYRMKHAPSEVA